MYNMFGNTIDLNERIGILQSLKLRKTMVTVILDGILANIENDAHEPVPLL